MQRIEVDTNPTPTPNPPWPEHAFGQERTPQASPVHPNSHRQCGGNVLVSDESSP